MSDNSKIEWCDATWSPIRARSKTSGKVFHWCEKISSGCAHCYAATMAQRFGLPDYVKANRDKVEFFLDDAMLRRPLHWKRPRRIFVESCSDLFGDWVPEEWLDDCFRAMARAEQHVFQVLTKRPERALDYCKKRWGHFDGREYPPLPNIWLGVSVEDQQRANERIPLLLQTPAALRFLSCEPLLEMVDLTRCYSYTEDAFFNAFQGQYCGLDGWGSLDWVICGGESGPQARPFLLEWAEFLRDQATAAGVPYFLKQLGSAPRRLTGLGVARVLVLKDSKGGDPAEWDEALRVREFPRTAPR